MAPALDLAVISPQTSVPITVRRKGGTVYSEAIGIDSATWQQTHKLRPRKDFLDRLAGATNAVGPGMSAEGYKLGSVLTATIGKRVLKLTVLAIPWRLIALILAGSLVVVGATAAGAAWTATRARPISLLGGRE